MTAQDHSFYLFFPFFPFFFPSFSTVSIYTEGIDHKQCMCLNTTYHARMLWTCSQPTVGTQQTVKALLQRIKNHTIEGRTDTYKKKQYTRQRGNDETAELKRRRNEGQNTETKSKVAAQARRNVPYVQD